MAYNFKRYNGKLKDFSASQEVTCTVNVVISRKRCKETLLSQTTNRRWYMAYWTVSFPMTFSDPQGHLPVAILFKCSYSHSCAAVDNASTDRERRAVPLQQMSLLWRNTSAWQTDRHTDRRADRRNCYITAWRLHTIALRTWDSHSHGIIEHRRRLSAGRWNCAKSTVTLYAIFVEL